MADYRSVHCRIWHDEWFSELDTDGKLLWLYLLTNQTTSVSGIYELPHRFIAFETGLPVERIEYLLTTFKEADKIDFDDSVIWIKKFREYQGNSGSKVLKRIMLDFNAIPECRIKGIYAQKYGIDRVSIPNPESAYDTDTETDTETEPIQIQIPEKPAAKPHIVINPLQEMVLSAFNAKRFKNQTQAAIVSSWECYPESNVKAACTWAATRGFGLGQAIASIDKALPKWGAPKQNGNGQGESNNPMLRLIAEEHRKAAQNGDK